MTIENWWPKLAAEDQQWLIHHNGERVPTNVLAKVAHVGGLVCTPTSIIGETRPDGFYFSDEAVDWIEAIANGEIPTMGPAGSNHGGRAAASSGVPDLGSAVAGLVGRGNGMATTEPNRTRTE